MTNEESAQTLRALRKDLQLIQEDMCELFDISVRTYIDWEHGCGMPSLQLRKMAFLALKKGIFGFKLSRSLHSKYEYYFNN